MKILFLFPYPHDTAGSQRFRFEQYLNILQKKGFHCDLQSFLDKDTWKILYQKGHYLLKSWGIFKGFLRRFLILFRLHRYEYVFIHREASPLGPPAFEWLIAKIFRKRVIYDFDDAIWLPNTTQQNRWVAGLKFHQKTGLICKWAYKISAGNGYLCDYARRFNDRVVLNPTTIDLEHLQKFCKKKAHPGSKPVIGWTGTHSTLPYLEMILPVLKELEKDYTFQFLVIADKKPDFHLESFYYLPWNKHTEIEDLLRMDIGLMPMPDDPWSRGKCGFKALQYMALGIPALVSPVGVNRDIVEDGVNGYICQEPAEWKEKLIVLIKNPELGEKLGNEARKTVETKYAVQANRENFLNLFT